MRHGTKMFMNADLAGTYTGTGSFGYVFKVSTKLDRKGFNAEAAITRPALSSPERTPHAMPS